MQYYAHCSRSRFCNVSESSPAARWHAVVAAEGDERCLRGSQMHRTPFRFLELRNSYFLHENSLNNCVVLINWIMKKQTRAEDQKLKINLEWPNRKSAHVQWFVSVQSESACYPFF